jgi:chromosome partitioning protein
MAAALLNPIIILFGNLKGGVGKTSLVVNVARALAKAGKKILVIDADYQGHTSKWLSKDNVDRACLLTRKFFEEADPVPQVIMENLHLIGATMLLQKTDKLSDPEDLMRITQILKSIGKNYDLVLIDTHPSPNTATYNGLVAAHYVVMPMSLSELGLQGGNDLAQVMMTVRDRLNKELRLLGVVFMRCDGRAKVKREIAADVIGEFQKMMFQTTIPESCKAEEAIKDRVSVLELPEDSKLAQAYRSFINELHVRIYGTELIVPNLHPAPAEEPKVKKGRAEVDKSGNVGSTDALEQVA